MTAHIETPSRLASLFPSQVGRALNFERGDLVFATGDRTRGLFRVQSGLVRLVRHAADGREVTLHVAKPGDFFAEASLFSDVYHCDAFAEQSSELLIFSREHVLGGINQSRTQALAWIDHLSGQVQTLRAQNAILSLKTAEDRILAFLRLRNPNDELVTIDRPWKAIASELGLSHEALYRALARMEKRGIIRRDRNSTTVELIAHPSR
jgi:CRP-like cAMP-binding protein